MAKKRLSELNVGIDLKIFKIEGKWVPSEEERKAAWEMYVELITRIAVEELKPDEGLLREALDSLYSLFGTTRQILRQYGPSVAQPKGDGKLAFGYLAVAILNRVLRPVLAKWHPLLSDYYSSKDENVSDLEHEKKWEYAAELRNTLNETRLILIDWANILEEVAEVPSLIG
jgi:hypothetical protein